MSSDLLTPAQVCRELRLTPKEIQQLVAAGWLEVAQRIPYKNGDMDVFWKTQVQDLAKDLPKIRRGWEAEQAIKLGPQKAAARREDQRQFTLAVKKRKSRFLHSLEEFSESAARILRVCFYLFHLNHYAKYGHAYLYDYKERVLQRLWQELGADPDHLPGIFKVTFIPGTPRIRLCMDCRLKAQQQKKAIWSIYPAPGIAVIVVPGMSIITVCTNFL